MTFICPIFSSTSFPRSEYDVLILKSTLSQDIEFCVNYSVHQNVVFVVKSSFWSYQTLAVFHVVFLVVQLLLYLILLRWRLSLHVRSFSYRCFTLTRFPCPFYLRDPQRLPALLSAPFMVSLFVRCSCFVRSFSAGTYVRSSRTVYLPDQMSSTRSCCSSRSNISSLL